MGEPGEHYKNWIGSLIPDNKFAGYQIAKSVIENAFASRDKNTDRPLHLIAVAGDHVTQASLERVKGLKKAISEYPNVVFEQLFVGQ